MVKQYLHNTQEQIFGEENTPPLEVKEELQKTTEVQKLAQEVNKYENMLAKMMSLPIKYQDIQSCATFTLEKLERLLT
jgi:hypothetical protein